MNRREIAQERDRKDPLAHFKTAFFHPENEIYLDGNSLGKLPLKAEENINTLLLEQWGKHLIRSWNDHWLDLPKRLAAKLAQLLNVNTKEVLVGESTSVNLFKVAHALIQSGHYPKQFLTDSLNFPTDNYILEGISRENALAKPICINYTSDLKADFSLLKETISINPGVICLSLVSYKSAYYYPMKALNLHAKENNSIIIWDLSHAVGAVAIDLKETKSLVAIGCTYKYLNGGPGSPAFIYLDQALSPKLLSPIQGWFGHAKPFDFSQEYHPAPGIEKFDAGTPTVLSLTAMEAGIDITLAAGIKNIRAKSLVLSSSLIAQIQTELVPLGYVLESPEKEEERGSHVTISHQESWRICQCLLHGNEKRPKIIPDFRPPHYIRLGIAPLYIGHEDLWLTIERFKEIVLEKEYEYYSETRPRVT
ncbi:MAG: aminotransferase class V-fold PLP-dependent enzyme [Candidatus Arcticimaribacter sp.]